MRPTGWGRGCLRRDSKAYSLDNQVEMPGDEIRNPGEEGFRNEMVSSVFGHVEFVVPVRLRSIGNQQADG